MYYLKIRQKQVLKVLNKMEHERTSRVARTIASIVAISTVSGGIGFTTGRVSVTCDKPHMQSAQAITIQRIAAPAETLPIVPDETIPNETLSDDTSPNIPTETPPAIPDDMVTPPSEQVNVYYDCPLDTDLQDYIRELCEGSRLPMSLVIALIEAESSFREDVISRTNDYGLMQINKINHKWLSEAYGITDFLDPYQNVYCGIEILSQHYSRYQDVDKALMAYNLGETGARRLWNEGTYETSYTRKIKTIMEVYENEIEQSCR